MVQGNHSTSSNQAIEIKGASFSLLVLKIKSLHLEKVKTQLIQHFSKVTDFFAHNPIILDFQFVRDQDSPYFNIEWLNAILEILRSYKLVVVGVRNVNEIQRHIALMCQLGLLSDTSPPIKAQSPAPVETTPETHTQGDSLDETHPIEEPEFEVSDPSAYSRMAAPPPRVATRFKIINRPIRSGQRIYVPDADLIILAAVSPGAEIISGGSIHVYAPLRGRALAGVNGDRTARIFSYRMEAELVAIAGYYKLIEEDLPKRGQTRPTQVYLEGEKLIIEALKR